MLRITMPLAARIVILSMFAFIYAAPALQAQTAITLTPDLAAQGIRISDQFSGLSFETQLLLPTDGVRYFRADNLPLVHLFKTLGIKHLRIGGNTADNPAIAIPGDADIDSLFAFAKAADVKVVYTVRLKGETDAARDIPIVKYITDKYAANLDCFALGNEPNFFIKTFAEYKGLWEKMTGQIIAAVPQAIFCGPNTDRHYEWAAQFAKELGDSGRIKEINEHAYVGLSARKVTDVVAARDKMLSSAWVKLYQGVYDGFVPQALAAKLPYRLEETNTFFNGGKEGASDTFTAALWGVDYMYWWASHRATGINFHTGDKVAAGEESAPCRYAAYLSVPGGYDVHPVGYAIKTFDLGGHGTLILLKSEPEDAVVSAYAVLSADKELHVTIINKSHGSDAHDAKITLNTGKSYEKGQALFLANASHDIADKTGITLGGAPIGDDASWKGQWSPLPSSSRGFTITVPAASAAVIELSGD